MVVWNPVCFLSHGGICPRLGFYVFLEMPDCPQVKFYYLARSCFVLAQLKTFKRSFLKHHECLDLCSDTNYAEFIETGLASCDACPIQHATVYFWDLQLPASSVCSRVCVSAQCFKFKSERGEKQPWVVSLFTVSWILGILKHFAARGSFTTEKFQGPFQYRFILVNFINIQHIFQVCTVIFWLLIVVLPY